MSPKTRPDLRCPTCDKPARSLREAVAPCCECGEGFDRFTPDRDAPTWKRCHRPECALWALVPTGTSCPRCRACGEQLGLFAYYLDPEAFAGLGMGAEMESQQRALAATLFPQLVEELAANLGVNVAALYAEFSSEGGEA